EERFGGDRSIVGRAVDVDGVPAMVVGVLPATFAFPLDARFWRVMRLPRGDSCRSPGERPGTCFTLFVWAIGRLAPGVSIAQARTELAAIGGRLAVHPSDPVRAGVDVGNATRAAVWRRATVVADSARCRGLRAIDRLRQRCEPARGPRRYAGAGVRGPRGARSRPDAASAAAPGRESAARDAGGGG